MAASISAPPSSPLNLLQIKKRRAWLRGGLGTSTTQHARHLLGLQFLVHSADHAARAACFFRLGFTSALASLSPKLQWQ